MPSLFISYAHRDMQPTDWLDRLKLYLAPLRDRQTVEVWHDGKIGVGNKWRAEIESALQRATAAILLVGPGFLESTFISKVELPTLLDSVQGRGAQIYPLVVGYCAYERSVLEPYQAFNDPEKPLEAHPLAEQNKWLNDLSRKVDTDLRQETLSANAMPTPRTDMRTVVLAIQRHLETNHAAFLAQARRRNGLVTGIRNRLDAREQLQYEKFFFRFYPKLDEEERFEFDQIRAMTVGVIREGNQNILTILEKHPELLEEIPALTALRQHLVFWLNKYDRVFVAEPKMALLYTGVEDGVPFPENIDQEVARWLRENS